VGVLVSPDNDTYPKVAALYVTRGGAYWDLDGVDPWDLDRDARLYAGPHPVVAHPPCNRWCRMAALTESQYGYKRGDDGGCFAAALDAVETYGGVLEHPAWSAAWPAHGLPVPPSGGGWQACLFRPGHACYVEQGRYGHPLKKGTWLYAVGTDLPALRWGRRADQAGGAPPGFWRQHTHASKRAANATPPAFRDVLLALARSVDAR
jgi:hypothetical protein